MFCKCATRKPATLNPGGRGRKDGLLALLCFTLATSAAVMSQTLPRRDIGAIFRAAESAGRVGVARKTRPVDARPARPGEVITTLIKGEGKETQSKPALAGDMVVRNRCSGTGNEEYLVSSVKFSERYGKPFGPADAEGWREYRPVAPDLRYFILDGSEGDFVFTAPWGEDMIAKTGDAIVQDPTDKGDTYRVAASSFACTYEIQK